MGGPQPVERSSETVDGMFEGAGKVARGPFTKVQDPGRGVIPADAVDESTSRETLVFVIEDDLLHLVDGHREVSVLHHRVREEEIIGTRGPPTPDPLSTTST